MVMLIHRAGAVARRPSIEQDLQLITGWEHPSTKSKTECVHATHWIRKRSRPAGSLD